MRHLLTNVMERTYSMIHDNFLSDYTNMDSEHSQLLAIQGKEPFNAEPCQKMLSTVEIMALFANLTKMSTRSLSGEETTEKPN